MREPTIVDVEKFLETLAREYAELNEKTTALLAELGDMEPEKIFDRCRQLNNERLRLKSLDDRLIDILTLAGEQMTYTEHLSNYRVAFSMFSVRVDELHARLLTLRQAYQPSNQH